MKTTPFKTIRNKVRKNWGLQDEALYVFLEKQVEGLPGDLFEKCEVLDFFIRYCNLIKREFTKGGGFVGKVDGRVVSANDQPAYDPYFMGVMTWLIKKKIALHTEMNVAVARAYYGFKHWISREYEISYLQGLIKDITAQLEDCRLPDGAENPLFRINQDFRAGEYPDVFTHDAGSIIAVESMSRYRDHLRQLVREKEAPVTTEQITIKGSVKGESDLSGNLVLTLPMDSFIEKIQEKAVRATEPDREQQPETFPQLLTRKKVCELLHISPPTLHTWIRQGKITSYKLGKKQVRFKKDDVERLLRERVVYPFRTKG